MAVCRGVKSEAFLGKGCSLGIRPRRPFRETRVERRRNTDEHKSQTRRVRGEDIHRAAKADCVVA